MTFGPAVPATGHCRAGTIPVNGEVAKKLRAEVAGQMSHHTVSAARIDSAGTASRPRGPAGKVAAAVSTAGLAACALAGCYVNVGALQHRTSHYSVSTRVQTLVVNAHVGSVHVSGGASGAVSVAEHISFRHTVPVTTHRASAGTLTLDSQCPSLETCSVSYDITVPRAATVRVNDNVGAIRLESLSGDVTAYTNVGAVNLASVSGPVEITSHTGTIAGQDVSSVRATLRVSVGKIEVTFSAAPASIAASGSVGSVTLRVPGNVAYAVDAHASTGSTQVTVSRNPSSPHVITASTSTGSVTIEPVP
jgi:hypothetical protein